ncbi:MAG: heme-binding protein [Paracoccaceae bacterium]|nr:heme-binding protein [Paracoccaceae bacterium]
MAEISLSRARTIIRGTFKKGREMGFAPLSVVVLDAGGNIKAFEREDGAAPGRFQVAHGKAHGAVMFGLPGSVLRERAEQQGYFINSLNGAYDGKMVPVPGGILVLDKQGRTIGAVGVTGDTSDNDAIAGVAGVEGAGLTASA